MLASGNFSEPLEKENKSLDGTRDLRKKNQGMEFKLLKIICLPIERMRGISKSPPGQGFPFSILH